MMFLIIFQEYFDKMYSCSGAFAYTLSLEEQFYKNKSFDFGKKIKTKLRTKIGLLSYRT